MRDLDGAGTAGITSRARILRALADWRCVIRHQKPLAVALAMAIYAAFPGCSVERDNDGETDLRAQQGDCACEQPITLLVISEEGGEVHCNGGLVDSFTESGRISGICYDNKGFTFEVTVFGPSRFEVITNPDNFPLDFDLGGDDQEPVSSWEFDVTDESGGTVRINVP